MTNDPATIDTPSQLAQRSVPSTDVKHAANAGAAGEVATGGKARGAGVPCPPPFVGSVVENQEANQSPLVALLTQLYAKDDRVIGARADATGSACMELGGMEGTDEQHSLEEAAPCRIKLPSLPVFTYDHDCRILRESFASDAPGRSGVFTRPCLMGDSCMGMHKMMPGHRASGGVVLTELMTPAELEAFHEHGDLPTQRRPCLLCVRYNVTCGYLFARKQRFFSSAHLFNPFMNVTDSPGEYRSDCCLPMPADNGAWLGILGSFAMLRLDALSLVQDADTKRWYVDQSGMKQVFQRGLAQKTTQSVRCVTNKFDARAWLARFYEHRTSVKDRDLLFDDVDDLRNKHVKVPSPPHERYLRWHPAAVKSFTHKLLYYRINRLNELLDACGLYYGRDWTHAMHVFVDAHVPMVELFEQGQRVSTFVLKYTAHEDALPDACAEITNAALGGSASSISPLTAVMLRVLPELAQPTQVNVLLAKHAAAVAPFVHQTALCAMLGNYRDNVTPLHAWKTRKNILINFTLKACITAMKELQPDQLFFFYALREYIGSTLRMLPCVEALLEAQVAFAKQRARVSDAMRSVRNSEPQSFNDFIVAHSETFRRNYKRLPKRKSIPRGRGDRSNALCAVINRTVKKRNLKRTAGDAFDVDFFGSVIKRIRTDGVDAVDTLVGEDVQAAAEAARYEAFADNAAKATAGYSIDAADDTVRRLNDVAQAADVVLGVVRVPLPRQMAAAQLEAVARRFGVSVDDPKVARITRVMFCTGCHECKNFVSTRQERSGKLVAARAAGYRKISLNFENLASEPVCVEKEDCTHFGIETHDVITRTGTGDSVQSCVLVTRKMAITISPCCGQLVHANSLAASVVSDTRYDCPACAAKWRVAAAPNVPDVRKCAYCSKSISPKHAGNVALLYDAEGDLYKYGYCKSHWRPWCRTSDGYCTLDFVSRNMGNRRGTGLILPS